MHFAGAVGGHQHDRRLQSRLHGAKFGNGDLEIGQHFQQERLEGFVGAVDLVDQQHRRACRVGIERLQQRALDQEALGEHVVLDPLAVALALRFRQPDGDHLRAVIPLVDGGRNIEPLVALQADQPPPERGREHLGDLGLADAGLALDEQRPAHAQRQIEHRRQRAVGDVVGLGQQVEGGFDRGRERFYGHFFGNILFAHDLIRKPVPTFRDHAPGTLSYRAGVLHVGIEGPPRLGLDLAAPRRARPEARRHPRRRQHAGGARTRSPTTRTAGSSTSTWSSSIRRTPAGRRRRAPRRGRRCSRSTATSPRSPR